MKMAVVPTRRGAQDLSVSSSFVFVVSMEVLGRLFSSVRRMEEKLAAGRDAACS